MWLDRKKNWLGRNDGKPAPGPRRPVVEKSYSVTEASDMLGVSRQTVFKWLSADDDGSAVIPADAWYKLPGSGHIRIKQWIIIQLQGDALHP